jgi:hypothetical protein
LLLGAFLFSKFWKKFFKLVLSGAFGLGPLISPGGGLTGVLIVDEVLLELLEVGFESSF